MGTPCLRLQNTDISLVFESERCPQRPGRKPSMSDPPRKTRKRIVFATLIALIGCGAYFGRREPDTGPVFGTTRPTRGTFVRTVPALGEIRNYKPIIMHSDIRAWERPQILEMVPPGAFVKKGDVVLTLDASAFRKRINEPLLAVIADNARYDKALADEDIQKQSNGRRTMNTRYNAWLTRARLTEYEDGNYAKEKSRMEGSVKRNRQAMEQAYADYLEAQRLAQVGIASNQAINSAGRRYQKTRIDLDLSRSEVDLLDDFTFPREMAQLELAAESADLDIGRARLINGMESQIKRVWTLSFDRYRTQWGDYAEYLQRCIDACTIRAPQDGQVMYFNEDDKLVEVGQTTHYMQKLFSVSQRTKMSVAGRVSDRHFYSLKRGQEVLVSVPSDPNRKYLGVVHWLGPIPTRADKFSPESLHHKIEITLLEEGEDIKSLFPGMTANAEIVVDSRDDVLQLPIGAIVEHRNEYIVLVKHGERLERRVVRTGASDDTFIEIRDGADLDDDVVVGLLPEELRELASSISGDGN